MLCDAAARSGRSTRRPVHMAEQPISLDGVNGVSSGAPNDSWGRRSRRRSCGHQRPADHPGECTRPPNRVLPCKALPAAQQAGHIQQPTVEVFHDLHEVLARFLAIPAKQTQSERMFSTAGLTINKRRGALDPENRVTVFFRCNRTAVQEWQS